MSKEQGVYANANDDGLRFILPSVIGEEEGGLFRSEEDGHLCTIVGRGGSGKSILALQLLTSLLKDNSHNQQVNKLPDAAFYFTLEASPRELKRQILQFDWGRHYKQWYKEETSDAKSEKDDTRVIGDDEYDNGLYLLRIPSPVESLNTLNLQIRQTIARQLHQIGGLQAIVIDPMGAVNTGTDLRSSLSELKELAERHRTFVFLLTEKYAFDSYTSIEHYAQSIVHLEHDPVQQRHRRLYVQKARGQGFRSGYHLFALEQTPIPQQSRGRDKLEGGLSKGIRIFPSIEAQAAYAHERLAEVQQKDEHKQSARAEHSSADQEKKSIGTGKSGKAGSLNKTQVEEVPFFPNEEQNRFLVDTSKKRAAEKIKVGSAVFLMGPPGTFKEYVAGQFAAAASKEEDGATIYVSFKADFHTIRGQQIGPKPENDRQAKSKKAPEEKASRGNASHEVSKTTPYLPVNGLPSLPESFDSRKDPPQKLEPTIYFFDARSPLLTPEEILFTVQRAIMSPRPEGAQFRRAIIWGLRRLYDFPNFREGRAVQFLEALVTLLKAERITSLLVDWPDKQIPSAVPIVDLCQYIFLTRVCFSKESPEVTERKPKEKREILTSLNSLWTQNTTQVALLRAQRTRRGVHHDQGAVLKQFKDGNISRLPRKKEESFERLWLHCGVKWEEDLSLLS